jgi:hypothetical protein
MLIDEYQSELDKQDRDKKLHLSAVRNSIQERIKRHEQDIQNCLDTIRQHGDWTQKIKQMTELIEDSEIRISELKAVLEYCF